MLDSSKGVSARHSPKRSNSSLYYMRASESRKSFDLWKNEPLERRVSEVLCIIFSHSKILFMFEQKSKTVFRHFVRGKYIRMQVWNYLHYKYLHSSQKSMLHTVTSPRRHEFRLHCMCVCIYVLFLIYRSGGLQRFNFEWMRKKASLMHGKLAKMNKERSLVPHISFLSLW